MSDLTERVRTRLFPALLTAFGVTFLAVGLLSYGSPVDAGPARDRPPRRSSPAGPARHLCSRSRRWRPRHRRPPVPPSRPTAWRRASGSPPSRSTFRSWRPPPPPNDYPLCDVAMYLDAAQAARPGRRDVSVRPRSRRHVPAHPDRVTRQQRQEDARDGRRGLHERRQAVPVRDVEVRRHQLDLEDAVTATPSRSGSRRPRDRRARPARPRSSPSSCPMEDADHAEAQPDAATGGLRLILRSSRSCAGASARRRPPGPRRP